MRKETEICDICKKMVAEHKCEFCNVDLCVHCKTFFGIGTEDKIMFSIISCSNCNEILQGADLEKDFKNCPDTKRELIEIFKKIIQLEELEGKPKKKKEKDHDVFINPITNQFYPNSVRYSSSFPFKKKKDENHSFAWAASKAGKIMRYKKNDEDDDKA